jgi:hypothetical protein
LPIQKDGLKKAEKAELVKDGLKKAELASDGGQERDGAAARGLHVPGSDLSVPLRFRFCLFQAAASSATSNPSPPAGLRFEGSRRKKEGRPGVAMKARRRRRCQVGLLSFIAEGGPATP